MVSPADNTALSKIYREHVGLVWRQSRRLGMTQTEADDTVHEVFLVVHRRLHLFDPTKSMVKWLYGITRNVVRHQRRGTTLRLQRHERACEHERSSPLPDMATHIEARVLIGAALEQMTPERREVLVLADVEGLTAPEVAQALALNLNTVYSRLRRARRELAAAVASLDAVDESRTQHGA